MLSNYIAEGPSFQPDDPKSNQIARFHDIYLTTIQGCLYKAAPPFGIYGTRQDALAEYSKQLHIIADLFDNADPYLCGSEVSLADATLFPSIVFADYMAPKFQGIGPNFIPNKIKMWFNDMIANDEAFKKVHEEVRKIFESILFHRMPFLYTLTIYMCSSSFF